jgi:hypothetical protein
VLAFTERIERESERLGMRERERVGRETAERERGGGRRREKEDRSHAVGLCWCRVMGCEGFDAVVMRQGRKQ